MIVILWRVFYVQYISPFVSRPSDQTQPKSSPPSRTQTKSFYYSEIMKATLSLTFLITLLAATVAVAAPAPSLHDDHPQPPYPPKITVMSARSASPIHLLPMNAAGRAFWLGGRTQSYCPVQVGNACPPGNTTVIAGLSSMVHLPFSLFCKE